MTYPYIFCSPCTRGLTAASYHHQIRFFLFPVHTGINRTTRWAGLINITVPRAHGD